MFLVIAPAPSDHATALASAFAPARAAVLTCPDLAANASALRHPVAAGSWLTADAHRVALGDIEGVVNLVPAVLPALLTCYARQERDYQAAELHAWLTLLLCTLECRVVSRPGAFGLGGPVRGPLGWRRVAARCDVPATALELDTDGGGEAAARSAGARRRVTVVGGHVVGDGGAAAGEYTLRLAELAGVEHLRAWYAGEPPALVGASVIPDAGDALAREALASYMRS